MSTGQTLNNLEAILDRLLERIAQSSIELQMRGGMPKPTDMSYHDFWDQIAGHQKQLARIVRELRTIEHNLDFRSRLARRLPRHMRYSANQSVRSHRGHAQQVYEKAVRVEEALRDYVTQGQTPTTGDIMKGIDKLAKELQKTIDQQDYQAITEQLAQGRPQLDTLTRDNPIVSGSPLSLVVTLIVIWIGIRSKRNDDDDRTA